MAIFVVVAVAACCRWIDTYFYPMCGSFIRSLSRIWLKTESFSVMPSLSRTYNNYNDMCVCFFSCVRYVFQFCYAFFCRFRFQLYTIWVYNNLFKLNNMYTKHQPTKEWKKRTKTHTQMLLQGREQSVENQKCTKMNIQLKYPMYVWRCIVSVFLARKKN